MSAKRHNICIHLFVFSVTGDSPISRPTLLDGKGRQRRIHSRSRSKSPSDWAVRPLSERLVVCQLELSFTGLFGSHMGCCLDLRVLMLPVDFVQCGPDSFSSFSYLVFLFFTKSLPHRPHYTFSLISFTTFFFFLAVRCLLACRIC